ncbi:MAG: hypothetical protein NTZ10_03725 [Candidatus Saganbacteria bacterium]|nr:hypothetical protein [Candidatus Saganbacteria bacterium]
MTYIYIQAKQQGSPPIQKLYGEPGQARVAQARLDIVNSAAAAIANMPELVMNGLQAVVENYYQGKLNNSLPVIKDKEMTPEQAKKPDKSNIFSPDKPV